MLVDTANYLTSIAENEIVYYYRCIDFISDRDPKKPTYKSGEDLEILHPNDLYKPEYCPSMSACDIYLLQLWDNVLQIIRCSIRPVVGAIVSEFSFEFRAN